MDYDTLNEIIERYANDDKTKMAMMLTGDWGSGKTYYINNFLCPYLKGKHINCVVVSLFGIDNLNDFSKHIYLKLRFPTFSKKSEIKEYATIIGHNILNNAISFKGLNFNISEQRLKRLYESVDLNNILLIIEDIERSSIDVSMLLGYLNGLVEYDGARVLLVANENELLADKCLNSIDSLSESESAIKHNTDNYIKMKEKVVGDTIGFNIDIYCSVENIINGYCSRWIKTLNQRDEILKISKIVSLYCKNNLRAVIYALKKCDDIFSSMKIDQNFEDSFYQVAFEGALIVASKTLGSVIPPWEGTKHISVSLGEAQTPIFRFIYDYLLNGLYDIDDIISTSEEYKNYCCFERNSSREEDEDISLISEFYIYTEEDVKRALNHIYDKLSQTDYLGIYAYEKLSYVIITAGIVIDYDLEKIYARILSNVKTICNKHPCSSNNIIWGVYSAFSDDEKVKEEHQNFMKRFAAAIDNSASKLDFSYAPKDLDELEVFVREHKNIFRAQHSFISEFDNNKIIEMLLLSSAKEIYTFRSILINMYNDVPQETYDSSDKEILNDLLDKINQLSSSKCQWDKIQWLQINKLKKNLNKFISSI